MANAPEQPEGPPEQFDFVDQPETDQSFENALDKARSGERLTVADGVELMTTGTAHAGIDLERKEAVLEAADRRRVEQVGETVTFVANLNNNVTTACNTGCLFCNFKDRSEQFRTSYQDDHGGFTKTPTESRRFVSDALEAGIYEVTSVSGLHPAFTLDDEHRVILEASDRGDLNYRSPSEYEKNPGTYCAQMDAMSVGDVHVHSMTPEEAYHARRGTDWDYREIYTRLKEAGLDSVPVTLAALEPKFWKTLCDELGTEHLVEKHRSDDPAVRETVREELQSTIRTRTRDEWEAALGDEEVMIGLVNTPTEALDDPHVWERGIVTGDDELPRIGFLRMSRAASRRATTLFRGWGSIQSKSSGRVGTVRTSYRTCGRMLSPPVRADEHPEQPQWGGFDSPLWPQPIRNEVINGRGCTPLNVMNDSGTQGRRVRPVPEGVERSSHCSARLSEPDVDTKSEWERQSGSHLSRTGRQESTTRDTGGAHRLPGVPDGGPRR